jgi:hypothetical protein
MECALEEVEAALTQLDDLCRELEAEKVSLESSLELEERAFRAYIEQVVNAVEPASSTSDRDTFVAMRKIRRIREQLLSTKVTLADLHEQQHLLQLRKVEASECCKTFNHEFSQYRLNVVARRAAQAAEKGCRRVEAGRKEVGR